MIVAMSHVSFYRKYRSETFETLVGQQHIVQTLTNAISTDRLSHAYIFSGPRGTGKTSTARILAKTLNVTEGQTFQDCPICLKISQGTSVDVIEIDAASNTGVDNIRELNEQVNFVPVECTYKVYIIDEAHMLSVGAFNALLKTLEEPPEKTVFVLATTEPHKIPITIHSRCQSLNFRRLTHTEIIEHLQFVSEQESISLSSGAAMMIAQNSDGCMRDALSLLDQLYSFKGAQIEQTDVQSLLGSIDQSLLLKIMNDILGGNSEGLVETFKLAFDDGVNTTQLCEDLMVLSQTLVYLKSGCDATFQLDEDYLEKLKGMIQESQLSRLVGILEGIAKIQVELKWFPNPEVLLQVHCLLLAQGPSPVQVPISRSADQAPSLVDSKLEKPILPSAPPIQKEPASSPPPQQQPKKSEALPTQSTSTSDHKGSWSKVLKKIESEKRTVYTLLHGSFIHHNYGHKIDLVIDQEFPFFLKKLTEASVYDYLLKCVQSEFPSCATVHFLLKNDPVLTQGSATSSSSGDQTASTSNDTAPVSDVPKISKTINQIVQLFEGELVSS